MKTYNARKVFNFDDVLPLDGEDTVDIILLGGSVNVRIFYTDSDTDEKMLLTLIFDYSGYFLKSTIPGYGVFGYEGKTDPSTLDSLVEYERSDWVDNICKFTEWGGLRLSHYKAFFLSAGIVLDVVSPSWRILDPVKVSST